MDVKPAIPKAFLVWRKFGTLTFELLERITVLSAIYAAGQYTKWVVFYILYAIGSFALIFATQASIGILILEERSRPGDGPPSRVLSLSSIVVFTAISSLVAFGVPEIVRKFALAPHMGG